MSQAEAALPGWNSRQRSRPRERSTIECPSEVPSEPPGLGASASRADFEPDGRGPRRCDTYPEPPLFSIPPGEESTKPRGRVFAVVNQKGGVGKTTTAVNLSASLAASERSTLLVDLDPQANATSAFGLAGPARQVYDALLGGCGMKDVALHTELGLLKVVT